MDDRCLAVFTTETPVRILREGGSRGWRINPSRAREIPYLVCVHNHANPAGQVPGSTQLHRAVFLVARISGVVPAAGDNRPNRWKICISAFFRVSIPEVWQRWPNPVKYSSFNQLGINAADLDFHDLTEAQGHIERLTERHLRRKKG
jgi:hypothetical protein